MMGCIKKILLVISLVFAGSAASPLLAFVPAVNRPSCAPAGNITAIVRSGGAVDAFGYDSAGNETWRIDGAEKTVTSAYDVAGNQIKRVSKRGVATENTAAFTHNLMRQQKSAKPEASPLGDRDFEAVGTHGVGSGIPRRNGNCYLLTASNAVAREVFTHDVMDCGATAATTAAICVQYNREICHAEKLCPIYPSRGYPTGRDMFYECLRCGDILPSAPSDNVQCKCRNIMIDVDYGRIVVQAQQQFKIFNDMRGERI
jgi:hypothetical protein